MRVGYAAKEMREETCTSCGTVFLRSPGRRMHQCFDCRMAKVMAVAAQAHGKKGLYWEKTVRGQLKRWKQEAEALGIET